MIKILNPEITPPEPPRIRYRMQSASAEKIRQLNIHLSDLRTHCEDFSCNIALYNYAKSEYKSEMRKLHENRSTLPIGAVSINDRWTFIAARNGALSLRNFSETLKSIKSLAGSIDEIREKFDLKKIREIRKDFYKMFPEINNIRNAVAHPEDYSDPRKTNEVSTDQSIFHPDRPNIPVFANYGSKLSIQNALINSRFTTTFRGKPLSYDVTTENAANLVNFTKDVFSIFQ